MRLWRRVRPYVALSAVFVLGAAAGTAATSTHMHRRGAASLQQDRRGFENRRFKAMASKLDLDEAQEAKMQALFDENRQEVGRLGKDMFDRCGEPLREQHARFEAAQRALLRPEQLSAFEALENERREHARFGPGGGMGPPPPFFGPPPATDPPPP